MQYVHNLSGYIWDHRIKKKKQDMQWVISQSFVETHPWWKKKPRLKIQREKGMEKGITKLLVE